MLLTSFFTPSWKNDSEGHCLSTCFEQFVFRSEVSSNSSLSPGVCYYPLPPSCGFTVLYLIEKEIGIPPPQFLKIIYKFSHHCSHK